MKAKMEIKTIQKGCLEGRLNVGEAVTQINKEIDGITRVEYKDRKKFKVYNHTTAFALDFSGLKKREMRTLYELAAGLYKKAQANGSRFPGGLHISRQSSTKHHKGGLRQYEVN